VLRQAFQDVLTRVSGRSDVALLPGMDTHLKQASRYVQQYRYRGSEEPVIEPVSGEPTRQILWIRFNEKAVNQLLYSQHLPVWGRNRPAVLLWLVVDDGKQRQLISNDSSHEALALINQQARLRGLPVRFPLLDLTDRANLRISDVWANFEDTILAASRRYQAEAILVGRVYQGFSGGWNARWSLYNQGRQQDWEFAHEQLQGIAVSGINQSSDFLALRFARVQQEGSEGRVLLQVNEVQGLAAYNKVRDYLLSLTSVTQAQPYQVAGSEVIFEVTTRSGRIGLEQAISLGATLLPEQAVTPAASGQKQAMLSPQLVYRLIK
jgi:hypothetical protein